MPFQPIADPFKAGRTVYITIIVHLFSSKHFTTVISSNIRNPSLCRRTPHTHIQPNRRHSPPSHHNAE
ncbi:hypothetical protein LXL04_025386 [Taraxacum kok-saghyz]